MSELNSIAEGSVEKLANDETKKNNNINNTEINKAEAPLSIFIPKKSESPLNLSQPSMPSLVKSKESESSGNIVASPRMSAASRTGSAKVATPTPKIRHRSQSTNNATNSTGQKFGRLSLKSKKNSDQNFHQDQTSSAPIFGNTDGSNPEIESPGSPSSRPSNENIENSSAASSVKRSPRSPERSRISSLLKIRSRESNNEENEVLVGTPVKEGHANYLLMFDMLTGIRISVSRCNSKENKPTEEKLEFVQSHKVAFDESGQEVTPRTDYDFKFKDYAPWIFKKIRDIFHVESSDYLASLTGKYVLSELGSPGKSGSFFYFSSDYRFIIKTIHHSEHIFMRKKLKQYYNHVKDNPDTLLSRILGLHRVKLPGNKKIHFVVMGNVFPAHKDIHEIYDLKGSTIGRVFNEEEALKNPASVLKDINWINRKQNLQFGPTKKKTLINQMEKDVKYLQDNQIMDYSLLIGIHDMVKGNKELLREKSLQVVDEPIVSDNQTDATPVRKPTLKRNTQKQKRLRTVSDPVLLTPINSKLSSNLPPERKYCTFYQDFGGYQATNEEDVIRPIVYYIGIIDIFTHYNYKKKAETYFRSLSNDSKKISSVKPKFYGERFLKFMKNSISEKNPSTTDGLKSNLKNKDFNPKHPDKKIIKKKYKVKLKPIEIKKNAHRKELSNSILKVFDPQNQLVDAQEHYRYFKEKYEHIMENLGEPEDLINRNEFISEKLKTTKSCRTKMLLNAKVNKDLFSSQVSKLNADNAFGIKNYYLEPLLTFNDAIGINKERKLQLLDREQLEIDSLPIQLDESDDDDFTQISSDFKKSLIIKQISNRSIHEEEEEGKNIIDYEKMISQNTGIQKEDKSKVDTPKADTKAYSYENLLSSLDKNIENTPDYGARSLLPNINPNSCNYLLLFN
ncbi:Phosphatidylinositol-4-phosphate 5-kinase [Lobulomyces angularis]|nr:Phosphatidylinositol-4-phosphate 5-kinase [Lobulomyces angularis]